MEKAKRLIGISEVGRGYHLPSPEIAVPSSRLPSLNKLQLIHGGRGNGERAIGKMNIGELFSSVLMGKVADLMGNLEGVAKTLIFGRALISNRIIFTASREWPARQPIKRAPLRLPSATVAS